MPEKTILDLECDCGFSAQIKHTLDTELYILNYCPVCGDDYIYAEELEDDDDNVVEE